MHEPCLQWVYVSGKIHHVSDFANLEPWQRPDTYCPVCGKHVILKLGDIRVHHAAHYEGTICAATQPETAIHLNSKYYLQKILRLTDQVKIWQQCSGWIVDTYHFSCHKDNRHEILYLKNWDRVEVEWQFGKYRLDVALLNGNQVVGAIEVLVTHPSEREKISYLDQQGIAWIELRVTPEFYTAPTAWMAETPLETENYNHSLIKTWRCEYCTSSLEDHKKNTEEALRYQAESEKKITYARQFEIVAVRLVDFYFPSGKLYRKIYVIQKRYDQDELLYMDLQEVTESRRRIAIQRPPITEKSFEKLKQALEKEIDKSQRPDWLIDKSRNWQPAVKGYSLKYYRYSDFHPYSYEQVNKKWQRVKQKSNSERQHLQERPPWKAFGVEIPSKPSKMDEALSSIFKEYTCTVCGKVTTDWIRGFAATKTCICRECGYK